MKRIVATLCLTVLFCPVLFAQDPAHRDTLWGFFANQEYYNAVLRATCITGETPVMNIVPNLEPFCFDKKITIKTATRNSVIEQCLYLDTKKGITAYLKPKGSRGPADYCDIKPDAPDFFFSVAGLKGNIYNYKNLKSKNGIEHWYSTGNTERYQYQAPQHNGSYTLHKKGVRRDYCSGLIKGTSYKADGENSPVHYLFGKEYPADLNFTPQKYIGNFGIGYQQTDKGLYLILEMESAGIDCKITSIEDVQVCFDPRPFQQQLETKYVAKGNDNFQKEREKLDRDAQKAQDSHSCVAEKLAVINFQKENITRQEENLRRSQQGNHYQNQAAQQAMLGMTDPLISVQLGILQTKAALCGVQESMNEHPDRVGDYLEKKNCLSRQLVSLTDAESKMHMIDTQFATNKAKAHAEKSKLLLQAMENACN